MQGVRRGLAASTAAREAEAADRPEVGAARDVADKLEVSVVLEPGSLRPLVGALAAVVLADLERYPRRPK